MRPLTLILLPILLLAAGCGSSPGGRWTAAPFNGAKPLATAFPAAYYRQAGAGEYDVVLVDDVTEARPEQKGDVIRPLGTRALRQFVHLHVFWRATSRMGANPAAFNAAIDWQLIDGAKGGRVTYAGSGLILLDPGDLARVEIVSAEVRPAKEEGTARPPIGAASVGGVFFAQRNDARVEELLREMGRK